MVSVVVVGLPIITMIGPVTRASTSPHFSCSVPLSWRLHRPHHQRVLSLSLSLSLSWSWKKMFPPIFSIIQSSVFIVKRARPLFVARSVSWVDFSLLCRSWLKIGELNEGEKNDETNFGSRTQEMRNEGPHSRPDFSTPPPPPNNKKTWLKCSVNQSARPGEEEKLGKGRSTPCIVSDLLIRYRSGSRWQEMISSAPGRVINRGN